MTLVEFSRAYRAHMASASQRAYYGRSHFFNVGWWADDVMDVEAAAERLVREVARAVPRSPSRVLDVACGPGGTTRALSALWPKASVIGVDLAPARLTGLADCAVGGRFAAMDACLLAVASSSVDVVVSIEAAFHFASRDAFLREAHRVLRPGGVLVATDILFADASLIGAWMVRDPLPPSNPDAYATRLADAGWSGVEVRDVTERTWAGFCRHWRHVMGVAGAETTVADAQADVWLRETVRYYVLVSAEKPLP